jgi:hypothetical protein
VWAGTKSGNSSRTKSTFGLQSPSRLKNLKKQINEEFGAVDCQIDNLSRCRVRRWRIFLSVCVGKE